MLPVAHKHCLQAAGVTSVLLIALQHDHLQQAGHVLAASQMHAAAVSLCKPLAQFAILAQGCSARGILAAMDAARGCVLDHMQRGTRSSWLVLGTEGPALMHACCTTAHCTGRAGTPRPVACC